MMPLTAAGPAVPRPVAGTGAERARRAWPGLTLLVLLLPVPTNADERRSEESPAAPDPLWTVTLQSASGATNVEGRIVVEAQDGGLIVEERNGRLRQLRPAEIVSRQQLDRPFSAMTAEQLAADLLATAPDGFVIHQTGHYVVCTNSAEPYAEFVGKLLEKVYSEYFKFFQSLDRPVRPPPGPLPVLVFHSVSEFKDFAKRQHPETNFEDTPGYYSIRENQMLLLDLTRDRSLRTTQQIRRRLSEQPLQVSTVVHEAVHQLAFNTGLQVRLADNPLWLTEGLAMYFEPVSPRTTLLWVRPGGDNARHHATFLKTVTDPAAGIPFSQLTSLDAAYLDAGTVAGAYAGGWALTAYLVKHQRDGLSRYLDGLARRKPLQAVTDQERIQEFRDAFGKSPDEMQADVVSFVRRLRDR